MKGRGSSFLAAQELVNVKAATDHEGELHLCGKPLVNVKAATNHHDWRALECFRTYGIRGTIRLVRTRPGDE